MILILEKEGFVAYDFYPREEKAAICKLAACNAFGMTDIVPRDFNPWTLQLF